LKECTGEERIMILRLASFQENYFQMREKMEEVKVVQMVLVVSATKLVLVVT